MTGAGRATPPLTSAAGEVLPFPPRNVDEEVLIPPACADERARAAAEHIIVMYSKDGLRRMLRNFRAGRSNASMARWFGVSPQRIGQWRTVLGETRVAYRIHEKILRIAGETVGETPCAS